MSMNMAGVTKAPQCRPGTGCIRIGLPGCALEPDDMVHSYNVNMTSKCMPIA